MHVPPPFPPPNNNYFFTVISTSNPFPRILSLALSLIIAAAEPIRKKILTHRTLFSCIVFCMRIGSIIAYDLSCMRYKVPPFLQMCQAPAASIPFRLLLASIMRDHFEYSECIMRSAKRFRLRLLCYCVRGRTCTLNSVRKTLCIFHLQSNPVTPITCRSVLVIGAFQIAFQ